MFEESLIGFHAAYVTENGEAQESGVGNAIIGAYLTKIGLSIDTVIFATSARPQEMNWLNYSTAQGVGISALLLTDTDRQWVDALDSSALTSED